MSYDISLNDPVTNEVISLPVQHIMTGGTYQADYDQTTGTFSPKAISEAWLNITYNYAHYYYEATEDDSRFEEVKSTDGKTRNAGIRGLYGKTGAESISMLTDMISRIEKKYKPNGEWIVTQRRESIAYDKDGNKLTAADIFKDHARVAKTDEKVYDISEGNTENYWTDTAANALRPLHQLLAFARLRPDGIWDGD